MSAARRKGKWVGGCPVLGYDVDPGGGRLVVNEEEAERVRAIFALFEEHGSAVATLAEIERRGWRLKSWTRKTGQFRAGGPFALNSLRRLLTNILYTGAIRHKGQAYPGEHAAILAPGTWERVQNLIDASCGICARQIAEQTPGAAERTALLRILRDADGVLVCGEERSQVSLLCVPERAAQGLGGVSREIASRARIEESVLGQIRETQRGICDPAEWEQMDRTRQVEAIQAIVERIGYDGRRGNLHPVPSRSCRGRDGPASPPDNHR